MTGKKAVLNVTVSESLAADVRREAARRGTTISSVVEEALAGHVERARRRAEGLAAIEEIFRQEGWLPSPGELAEADRRVAGQERLIDEARARRAARSTGSAA